MVPATTWEAGNALHPGGRLGPPGGPLVWAEGLRGWRRQAPRGPAPTPTRGVAPWPVRASPRLTRRPPSTARSLAPVRAPTPPQTVPPAPARGGPYYWLLAPQGQGSHPARHCAALAPALGPLQSLRRQGRGPTERRGSRRRRRGGAQRLKKIVKGAPRLRGLLSTKTGGAGRGAARRAWGWPRRCRAGRHPRLTINSAPDPSHPNH